MASGSLFEWTNASVRAFSKGQDPVEAIETRARAIVLSALDRGWSGPPFDPIKIADLLKIGLQANADIRDARTFSDRKHGFVIEFNPTRSRGRVRFSIAHEIAHTFFPDCAEGVRNRAHRDPTAGDDWQLELLCNIAASELIMPIGSFRDLSESRLEIDHLMRLRKKYDVSTEAILMRMVKLSTRPASFFVASRIEKTDGGERFRIEYSIPSPEWRLPSLAGSTLDDTSILSECTAVGYTASATQRWPGQNGLYLVQCVGIPPYPGARFPRIGGIVSPVRRLSRKPNQISYVQGNALEPRGSGQRLVAHIVNDRTPNWGGGGFASAAKKKWPSIQNDFRSWARESSGNLKLDSVHISIVDESLSVASMVAQKGYGRSTSPRINYEALSKCLEGVAEIAKKLNATVHMPRIGTGNAGGAWEIIGELIKNHLVDRGINVAIYDLPERTDYVAADGFLSNFARSPG